MCCKLPALIATVIASVLMTRLLPFDRIKKILIVRPDALGDMMLTLPAIRAIRDRFPDRHIAVLASPYNAQLIRHLDWIDEIILDWKRAGKIKGWRDRLHYIRELRLQKFDLAVHFYSETDTVWTMVAAGIPYHIGDKAKIGLWPVFRKYGSFLKTFDQTMHVVAYNFQLLKSLGIELNSDVKLNFQVTDEMKRQASTLLKAGGRREGVPLVGIQIGVGAGNRPIEPEKYAQFIDELRRIRDVDVCMTAFSDKEKAFKDRVLAAVKSPVIVLEKTTMDQLLGVISSYDCFVSVDTGPFHIAASLQ
ncbi:lipopolysaccharide heptosyltransferase family protein, partial [bacterium]|nr:lipopolysaccharide heptosyltransferase family protein [bacterium]